MSPKSYFSRQELNCRCRCGAEPNPGFVVLLNRIREDYLSPISVTSVMRCAKHNKEIGGAKNSSHTQGVAADLVRTPQLLAFITANLERYGLYMEDPASTPSWIHISTRPVANCPTRIFKP